ncbi:MAG: hypothetical protein HEQ21_00460 [Blastomonas sp.]|uniref:hypothetical protein n=1 Tax=Blastomonas sp. TaxID=1909299 RepID=UPI0025907C3F|nr:hypothetical protein [Blastomonas sp.]MCO5791273.1 hypothetical protein [Blastomonas sp.]
MKTDELERWTPQDRIALFRSAEYLGADARNAHRIGLCLDTIMNDLEAYDDPAQGLRHWLYENEAPLLKDLAERLHDIVGAHRPIEAGQLSLQHERFASVREAASRLAALMKGNGKISYD